MRFFMQKERNGETVLIYTTQGLTSPIQCGIIPSTGEIYGGVTRRNRIKQPESKQNLQGKSRAFVTLRVALAYGRDRQRFRLPCLQRDASEKHPTAAQAQGRMIFLVQKGEESS